LKIKRGGEKRRYIFKLLYGRIFLRVLVNDNGIIILKKSPFVRGVQGIRGILRGGRRRGRRNKKLKSGG